MVKISTFDTPSDSYLINGHIKTISISAAPNTRLGLSPGLATYFITVIRFELHIFINELTNESQVLIIPVFKEQESERFLMFLNGSLIANKTNDFLTVIKCLQLRISKSSYHVSGLEILDTDSLMKLFMSQYLGEKYFYNNSYYYSREGKNIKTDTPKNLSSFTYVK